MELAALPAQMYPQGSQREAGRHLQCLQGEEVELVLAVGAVRNRTTMCLRTAKEAAPL